MTGNPGVVAALLVLSLSAMPARASETVLGGGFAKDCEFAATVAAEQGSAAMAAIDTCNKALGSEALPVHDVAATYVNRGILYLVDGKYEAAQADFGVALQTLPTLGGAHADMGAVLIAQHQFAAGIAEIDRGLALNSPQPEKAYFNRAVAREQLGDLKGAYFDFMTAAQMKPAWQQPKLELARFKVQSQS